MTLLRVRESITDIVCDSHRDNESFVARVILQHCDGRRGFRDTLLSHVMKYNERSRIKKFEDARTKTDDTYIRDNVAAGYCAHGRI